MLGTVRVTYGTMVCIAALAALAMAPATAVAKSGDGTDQGAAAAEPKPVTEGSAPRYVCEKPSVNFEDIWEGNKLSVSWIIKNTGTSELNIKLKGG